MIVHRRLIGRNFSLYPPLRHMPITPATYRATLQWFLALSGWNHDDCHACLEYDGKASASTRNIDDLVGQLEHIWLEIPQEAVREHYHSLLRHVAAFIQARSWSAPFLSSLICNNVTLK
ncbi:hypothetical protein TNCV_3687661 [Trichonephila clavipes]|nr:hypothetical protein TNCV_3687661 [Trichonephila clavipes]